MDRPEHSEDDTAGLVRYLAELSVQEKLDRILEKEIRLRKQEREEFELTKDAPDKGSVSFGGIPLRKDHWRIGRTR